MLFNVFIYSAAGLVFGWNKAMYAVLTYFIAFRVIDVVLEGLNSAKSIRIISDKAYEIGQELLEKLDIGVTYLKGVGAYSGAEKTLIYCVVSRLEMAKMKEIIKILILVHLFQWLMFTRHMAAEQKEVLTKFNKMDNSFKI